MATISSQTISLTSQVMSKVTRPVLNVAIPTAHHVPVFKFPQWAVVPMAPFDPFKYVPGLNGIRKPANLAPVVIPPVHFSPAYKPFTSPIRSALSPPSPHVAALSPISASSEVSPMSPESVYYSPVSVRQAPIGWKPIFKYSDNPATPSTTESDLEALYPPTPISAGPSPVVLDPFKTRFSAADAELYFHYYESEPISEPIPEEAPETPAVKSKVYASKNRDRRTVKKSFKKQRRHYNQRTVLISGANETKAVKVFLPEYVHRATDDVCINIGH